MLLHAGYSAFEALTYEKSIDPTAALEIPLDVSLQCGRVFADEGVDSSGDGGVGDIVVCCSDNGKLGVEACQMERVVESTREREPRVSAPY